MASEAVPGALPEAEGEFIQEVEDDLDLDYSGVGTYADALRGEASATNVERIGSGKPPKMDARPQTARPASALTSRSRPASRRASRRAASAQQHLAGKKCIETTSPLQWDTAAVGVWLTSIGMGQYRKHFTHNAVDGRLLLALDMHMLKAEMKISPFGHRATICDAIQQLRMADPDSQRSLSPEARSGLIRAVPLDKIPRPVSAPSPQPRPPTASGNVLPPDSYLGPAMGKMTVYDNLKKLQYDLFRAEEKAKHVEAVKADMDRKHRIYVDNVMRVKGELTALQKGNKLKLQQTWSPSNHNDGAVPWMHTGPKTKAWRPFPERYGQAGDGSLVEETFRPKLCETPSAKKKREEVGRTPFTTRLQNAIMNHQAELQELFDRIYSAPRPELSKADLEMVTQYFMNYSGESELPDSEEDRQEKLNDMLDDQQVQKDFLLTNQLVKTLKCQRGDVKLYNIAALLKQKSFMSRLTTKSRRGPAKYQPPVLPNPLGQMPDDIKARDREASLHLASRLGWSLDSSGAAGEVDPDNCTDKIRAIFARAQYYKQGKVQEKDSGKVFVPDWDGLAKSDPVQNELTANMAQFLDKETIQAQMVEASKQADPDKPPVDLIEECTKLLAQLTDAELTYRTSSAFQDKPSADQLLLFYRTLRGQEFLARQQGAVSQKQEWIDRESERAMVPRKVVSKASQDAFYVRLQKDADQRVARKAEAMSAKLAKEAALLKSSKLWRINPRLCRSP